MNVTFLSYYSGLNFRGVETFVHEVSNSLVDLNVTVSVYSHGPKISGSTYQTEYLEKIDSLPDFVLKPDVLISNNGRIQSLKSSVWCKLNASKLVIPGHSGIGLDDRLNLYTFPDYFICLSDFQKNWAKSINPFVKLKKITDGVNLSKFNPQVKPFDFGLPKPIILCVGALEPIKRQDLAIRAVSQLTKGSLVLVGSGTNHSYLQQLGDELLPARFNIISANHSSMPSIYTGADIFTFPTSPWEASGLVLYEAMASNLPIVVSNDPIRTEIVGSTGVTVDVLDHIAYSKALEYVISKNWRSDPNKFAQKHSWDLIAKDYLTLFNQLCQ